MHFSNFLKLCESIIDDLWVKSDTSEFQNNIQNNYIPESDVNKTKY